MTYGKSIELFLVNGTADSLIIAELSNWNGKAIKIPRIEVAACGRNDIAQPGVYFLFCKEDDGSDSVYIGEAENVKDRLVQHLRDYQSEKEKYCWNTAVIFLVACIVEGIPFVSNISETYGAFYKEWERRSHKKYEVYRLDVCHNGKNNRCFNQDGVELLKTISGDILYIDPPYNSRQYLPNYHVLETAAKYDYPEVRGITAQRPYENNKSDFCLKTKVVQTFDELMKNAKFEYIILSYSTDGLMSVEKIETTMKKYGKPETFKIYWIPYRRCKSRAQGDKEELKEMLAYIEK